METYKDWLEKLSYALWGYRMIVRTSTGMTPFFLIYGTEAIMLIELKVKSLRVVLETRIPKK